MKITKGLFTDCAEVDQPAGTYRFAKNIVNSNTLGSIENELGFEDLGIIAPYPIIGIIPTGLSFAVFSTDNTSSEIGIWGSGSYTQIYNSPTLNFDQDYPVTGEFRLNVKGERVVAFIDGINSPRLINLDDPDVVTDAEELDIFQKKSHPYLLTYDVLNSGGSLTTGAYIPITKYANDDGTETEWYVYPKVFFINDEPTTSYYPTQDGAEPGSASGKSIYLFYAGLDDAYEKIVHGYIKVQNSIVTAHRTVEQRRGTSGNTTIRLTGNEASTTLDISEVLTPNAFYTVAKAITQVRGQLVLGNLKSDPIPGDIMKYALAAQINYGYTKELVYNQKDVQKNGIAGQSLMPGEVYAFYIGVELTDGRNIAFHVPGRPAVTGETTNTSVDGLAHRKFQIQNTSNAVGAQTNMGFWRNESELYPNLPEYDASSVGGPNLSGGTTNVRHHRMPTMRYLSEVEVGDPLFGITYLPKLYVTVSNFNLPPDLQEKIVRWRLYYAKKSSDNSINMGSDLYQGATLDTADGNKRWTSAGNWRLQFYYNDGASNVEINYHRGSIRCHNLDFLYKPEEAKPSYFEVNYRLYKSSLNTHWTGWGTSGARFSTSGENYGTSNNAVIDYAATPTVSKSFTGLQYRNLPEFIYLPQNSEINTWKNLYAEACFVSEITPINDTNHLPTPGTLATAGTGTDVRNPNFPSGGEYTFHLTYGKLLSDVHVSFLNQELVPLEGTALPTDTTKQFNGGDGFLCHMSFLSAAPLSPDISKIADPNVEGVRVWRAFVGHSRRNWNYRHEEAGELSTFFYPKTDPRNLVSPSVVGTIGLIGCNNLLSTVNPLQDIKYNEDYSHQNIYVNQLIYDPEQLDVTEQPTTIIYSTVQNEESVELAWKTFPAGNRYIMPRNKGVITNLVGIDNQDLLIHHEHTLYRTRTTSGLKGDSTNIYLKTNDLFEIEPEEVVTSDGGYGGTKNPLSCIVTKAGYAFVDDTQGKVFLYTGQLEEISGNGLRQFFRDNMNVGQDNPYKLSGYGYSMVYDEYYNRLLLNKQHGNLSWTVSYNPITKSWVSYHDYMPRFMFPLVNGQVYSLSYEDGTGNDTLASQKLYKHNAGNYGTFYGGITYPVIIDIPFNPEPVEDKIFVAANWLTESYDSNGVLQYDDTFNHITIRSKDHTTDRLVIAPSTEVDFLYDQNVRNLNRVWYYNGFRDIAIASGFTLGFYDNYNLDPSKLNTNMEWFDQRNFIDKFVICRLEYANAANNKLLLLDTNIQYQHAPK